MKLEEKLLAQQLYGKRRCICVTNNEIAHNDQPPLIKQKLQPGDDKWEEHGIAQNVTWPRTKCTIEGVDMKGKPLERDYGIPARDIDLGYSLPKSEGFKTNAVFVS